jgi:hypothetical protein
VSEEFHAAGTLSGPQTHSGQKGEQIPEAVWKLLSSPQPVNSLTTIPTPQAHILTVV